ncbi:lysozyme family protein [Mesobacillus foraminis]|uniref:bifunctional lytic transglycosylase/C40 family peptidase n=1 Tax=Mesobacillus foraminis TaxID=279826 RepID=UPI001BED35F6|nr:bifunctional lytic transglycosylase/C40 family peptidase [Mesobacillus foraminis]MBT2757957.1 lysozyme family protein [Mesobacillus foraminis]
MSAFTAAKGTIFVVRNWKSLTVAGVFIMILMAGLLLGANMSQQQPTGDLDSPLGTANVPPHISKWKGLVLEYTTRHGIPEYTDFLLALMYQEIGNSQTLDIMQSSESVGLPPNAIQDPVLSVDLGVQHFKSVLERGQEAGVDFAAIVQSYNFGSGYIQFVASNGGAHSVELAQEFSLKQAGKLRWSCSDWRAPYCYGDIKYVQKVMKNLDASAIPIGSADVSPLGEDAFETIISEARKYVGWPYVWAGAHPSTGFDCSGFTQWTYAKAGIKLPRTAQEQYDVARKIPPGEAMPGDLVFYTGTYQTDKYITHIGIYMGKGKMFDSNGSGIGIHDISDPYWKSHLVGFGRIAH